MEQKPETYGAFSLSRQDIVELSRRIARCIPADFLVNNERPVIIRVDGNVSSGKKIIADYGRNEIFKADVVTDDSGRIWPGDKSCCGQLDFCGRDEHDEYVAGNLNDKKLEVSFINVAWESTWFSFSENFPQGMMQDSHGRTHHHTKLSYVEKSKALLAEHMKTRRAGGIVYVHNAAPDALAADIEIKLESVGDPEICNGGYYSCPDVDGVLNKAFNSNAAVCESDWKRYVEVRINNAELDREGQISNMLVETLGLRNKEDISSLVYRKNSVGVHRGLDLPMLGIRGGL